MVHQTTVQRLACDATVRRVLLDPEGLVLDVGRARRVVGPALRSALQVRDGGCVWPRCTRPARWCEAHHLRPWAEGGSTDRDNLVLLCGRHHWMLHEAGWQLHRAQDGRVLALRPAPSCNDYPARPPTRYR